MRRTASYGLIGLGMAALATFSGACSSDDGGGDGGGGTTGTTTSSTTTTTDTTTATGGGGSGQGGGETGGGETGGGETGGGETGGGETGGGETGGGGQGGAAGAGGSGGSAGGDYADCESCVNGDTGAHANECKAKKDACSADEGCTAIVQCAYFGGGGSPPCDASEAGACCTLDCYALAAASDASIALYEAYDQCVYCDVCDALCNYDDYCAVFEQPNGKDVCD